MRTNWILDTFRYMFGGGGWTTIVFDLLLLAGIGIGVWLYSRLPQQRTVLHVWTWLTRLVIGAMWWQQVIWKVPPNFAGLRFWTDQMVQFSSTDLQRSFVQNVVLMHFGFFAPQVFLVEAIISVALLLGLWSRLGSILGAAMALNLSQGLYRSPGEWPWQYVFLIIVMVQFSLVPPGRSLGLDVLLAERDKGGSGPISRLLRWVR
ncbi:MAG: DoxX family membrane protein [Acidobacteriota bacterium]|nr:DoxX family membrane protein [Acidobacteriota bacterium]